MPKQPLAEVFGFPIGDMSPEAARHREKRLCPFNNKGANCTKTRANDPLGVCSVFDNEEPVITCPVRFRQNWIIADDAADFFFPNSNWTTLPELRLKDQEGKSAGNIDVVIVSYDADGKVTDFGALEVQAVYISGNVRNPFEYYMSDPVAHQTMDWSKRRNYPNPDYLSSSRKRLAPQLIFKDGILHAWKKKTAVALNRGFFNTLPALREAEREVADIAWLVYDIVPDPAHKRFVLKRWKTAYTMFDDSLERITKSKPGDMKEFLEYLQEKFDDKPENPPENKTIDELL